MNVCYHYKVLHQQSFMYSKTVIINPNSLDSKGSCWILKGCYCSETMLRELGLMFYKLFEFNFVVLPIEYNGFNTHFTSYMYTCTKICFFCKRKLLCPVFIVDMSNLNSSCPTIMNLDSLPSGIVCYPEAVSSPCVPSSSSSSSTLYTCT